jgi:cytochrome c7-like protein
LKSKWLLVAVGVLVLTGIGSALNFWWHLGDSVGYSPDQPIPFSHKLHAGDNQIPCLYCHVNADKGRHATVPSLNVCMNCHSVVKTDSPYIKQIREHYEKGEPIEWIKVHDQPDFVYFNHRPHIARGVACETCHGPVKEEEQIQQVETLHMGFCIDCHRQNGAPISCYTCHR